MNLRLVIITCMLVCHSAGQPSGQPGTARVGVPQSTATVEVVAFSTTGKFLGPPTISTFEQTDTHTSFAAKFTAGVAEQIPFGEYRVEGYLTGFSAASRRVRVFQPYTLVVLGLPLGGIDFPIDRFKLSGRVVGGSIGAGRRRFVKLLGVTFESSAEARIESDGAFDLSGLTWGSYLLMVVDEGKILATKTLVIPYEGPAFQVEIGRVALVSPE